MTKRTNYSKIAVRRKLHILKYLAVSMTVLALDNSDRIESSDGQLI